MPVKRSYAEHGDACATAHGMEQSARWTHPILQGLMLDGASASWRRPCVASRPPC